MTSHIEIPIKIISNNLRENLRGDILNDSKKANIVFDVIKLMTCYSTKQVFFILEFEIFPNLKRFVRKDPSATQYTIVMQSKAFTNLLGVIK